MKKYVMYAGQRKIFIGIISIPEKAEEAFLKNMGVGCTYALITNHNPNKGIDLELKQKCQERWERKFGSRADFIKNFNRSYL